MNTDKAFETLIATFLVLLVVTISWELCSVMKASAQIDKAYQIRAILDNQSK